jgi:hypothetical protein
MKRLITLHSENLFFLFLFALLIIGFLCSSVTAENGPSPLVTPGSVSGLGTMAVVDSPVPVANGGTGKTTAAEALAALGGASLNGSSTVAFNASTINGVAPLTDAEKTQALVGNPTVDFLARHIITNGVKLHHNATLAFPVDSYFDLGTTSETYGYVRLTSKEHGEGLYFLDGVTEVGTPTITLLAGDTTDFKVATSVSGGKYFAVFVGGGLFRLRNCFSTTQALVLTRAFGGY